MRIGYFGGSFDPPHRGHLTVALAARERFALDKVLLAPTGRQPLKPDGPRASFGDRLAMTELLCAGQTGLEASAIDAPSPDGGFNYTADTLTRLRANLPPTAELYAIVGADAFLGLPHWHGVEKLFALAEWIVVSRPGSPLEQLEAMPLRPEQRGRVHLLDGIADPTSATHVRARLREGQPCEPLLPMTLCEYIRAHRLYGA